MILDNKNLIGITALLIHAAKIDENFSEAEKKVIKNFINVYSEDKLDNNTIFEEAKKIETNSNQLLNYTNIIKKNSEEIKYEIIDQLWKIIISDNNVDLYESNLMRRICGLIYFSDKLSGEIKLKNLNNKK
jgi:uncharacterized tellurite resistance protein B-like protein|tara:strand:- start:6 stop:398 length:393 start_codon:yes stop_codon:yes gene_type:complete